MPFYTDSDSWNAFQGDQWAQQAHGQIADQWAAQATADAPDRAAAAEQAEAQRQTQAQAQAQAEAQRQADAQAQQQAAAAAQAQQQQQQANTWAANQWADQAYSGAATAATGVAPAPAATPPAAPAATQTAAAAAPSSPLPSASSGNYVAYAYQAAQNAGIDPNIFVKQINQESGFNPKAQSGAGAMGIAQFMPATAQGLGVDPTNPLASLDGAAKLMSQYVQKYAGDYGKALAAYNAGPGSVDRFGGVPPFAETQTYVKNILGSAGQTVQDIAAKAGGAAQQLIQAPQQTAQDLLSKVQPFLGNAYVWGGKSAQQGFDCSGLAGYLTTGQPESTTTLYGKSSTITPDTAQPGDLVFWNMGSNDPHMQHVAVYLGNGQIVQSGGNQSAVNVGSVNQQIGSAPEFRRLGQGGAPAQANAPAGVPPPNAPPQQAQSAADFIQQMQANQGRMPTDTELGNFYLSQPPQQTAAAVGQPTPIQQPTSPFDVVGNIASGLGSAVSGAVSGMGNALGGLFGAGGPGGQLSQGPTETAPTSPFAGLPALPTGVASEGGGYGAGGSLQPGEAAQALAPFGEAVAGLAQNPLMPTNLTNAGLQALGQNVVAPGLEALAQPGGALIGPRTAAAQALEGLAGNVPSGVPVVGGLLQGAAGMVGGPTIVDAAQTASQIEQKYGGGLQTTPDGRQTWRPPDYSRITPEDQNALSNAMLAVGGVTLPPTVGEGGGTAAERAAAEAGGAGRPPIEPPTTVGGPAPGEPLPPEAPQVAAEPGLLNRLTQAQPEQAGNITLSKYPEDVRQVITDAASSLPEQMKAATRGVLPDQAVRDLSQQTGIDVDQIVRSWNPGQVQNAETLLALRDALTAQARKVIDAQQALRTAPDAVAAQGDLLQALTQHAAIQEVVSGSTAEAGRALRQFRQVAPGSDFATNQINQMAARSGMTPEEMASALGRVDLSDPAAVAQLARSLPQGPPTLDEIFKTYHTNNVISGLPTLTHVAVNSILAPAWSFATRSLADLAGLNFDRVQGGGIGFGAGLAHAGEDFLSGFRDVLNNPASVANRLGGPGGAALKAQGVFGALHGAFQNVAQGIIERTEIGRLAGEAATDQGLKGAAWTKFVADALDNPAADMVQQARGVAQRAALRGELGTLGQKMQQIANVPFVGNTLFPVVRISTNALTQGIERSPLGLLGTGFDVARAASGAGPYAKGFEPLTGAVTPLSERLTNNLAGTAITAFLVNKGLDGTITGDGPSDPKERAALMSQGWQANSVWLPGRGYVDYRMLGPIAQEFALVGNYADAVEEARKHPGQATLGQNVLEIAGNLAQRQASYMSDATGLRTLGQIYEVLHGGANAANVAAQFFGQMAGGFVPESAAVRGLVSAADPYARQPQKGDIGEVIAQGLPGGTPGIGGRTDLPVRLNELGQPETNPQAGLGIFVPRTGTGTVSPVMTLLGSEGLSPPSAPKTVRAGQQEITLTLDEQRQYQQLRGALLEQMMMPLTQNQQFSEVPGPARKQVLQRLMARADQVAQRQLIGAIAQTGDLVSRLGPSARQQEPVPFRPPLPLNELATVTSTAAAPSRAALPLTSDLATLDPLQQEQMRRQLAGTP